MSGLREAGATTVETEDEDGATGEGWMADVG